MKRYKILCDGRYNQDDDGPWVQYLDVAVLHAQVSVQCTQLLEKEEANAALNRTVSALQANCQEAGAERARLQQELANASYELKRERAYREAMSKDDARQAVHTVALMAQQICAKVDSGEATAYLDAVNDALRIWLESKRVCNDVLKATVKELLQERSAIDDVGPEEEK